MFPFEYPFNPDASQETLCVVSSECFNDKLQEEVIGSLFFPFLVALVVTVVLTPPLMKAAEKAGLLDNPDDKREERTVHTDAIPRVGGLALTAAIVLAIAIWLPVDQKMVGILVGSGVTLLFGVWDDRVSLNYKTKFLGQILASLCVAGIGGVMIEHLPFLDNITLSFAAALPLTVFVLVAVTNAINLADGLDGLSGGKTLLIFGCLAVLSYQSGDFQLAMVNVIFMGGILGFLRFNTHPARVFLGDAGSQMLGINAAALAIVLTQHSNSALSPVLPLLLFALPIFDTASVMVQRIYHGRSPFSPDKNHFHHKLLSMGFNHHEAVMIVYLMQSILVVSAYFLRYESDVLLLSLFFLVCFGLAGTLYWASRQEWRIASGTTHLVRGIFRLAQQRRLLRGAQGLSAAFLPLLLFVAVTLPYRISFDFVVVALFLLAATFGASGFGPAFQTSVKRICVYISGAFAVYFYETSSFQSEDFDLLLNAIFFLLVLAVMVGIRFSKENRFSVTTLDFLVVFLCFIVPLVSTFVTENSIPLAELSAKLVVFMYASELVMSSGSFQFRGLVVCSACALAVICVRWVLQTYFFVFWEM